MMVGLRFTLALVDKLQLGDLLLAVTGVGIRHVRDGPLEHSMDPVALRGVCVASLSQEPFSEYQSMYY
jgi:hypothetical protein